ncbi:Transposase [Streptomyces venezuelae]|nr:Transposase [Streptomyces venezuelae]CUM35896.1 Mobile element protein [Streptomyces venezuelae]
MTAGHSVDPARWQEAVEGLMARIAGRFAQVEPRRRVGRLVLGLLSDLPRKNCWTIAEWAGESPPDGMQNLLGRAKWDAGQVPDDVRAYVVEHLRDDQAVLVVDETGDVKKGARLVRLATPPPGPIPDQPLPAASRSNVKIAIYCWSTRTYIGHTDHGARRRCRPKARTQRGRPAMEHRSGPGPGAVCRRSTAVEVRRVAAPTLRPSATTAPAPPTARP